MSAGTKNKRTGSAAENNFCKMIGKAFSLKVFDGKTIKDADAQIGTARQFSRSLDGRKIDIWLREDVPKKLRKLAFQIKKKVVSRDRNPIDARVLQDIQVLNGEIPVLVTHFRHKSLTGKEMAGAWFVTVTNEDFKKIFDQSRIDMCYIARKHKTGRGRIIDATLFKVFEKEAKGWKQVLRSTFEKENLNFLTMRAEDFLNLLNQ